MRTLGKMALAALPGTGAYAMWRYARTARELDYLEAAPPRLAGTVRNVTTSWGRLSYRHITKGGSGRTLVLVHGWGRTADSAWWPVYDNTEHDILSVDLPGHGRSLLDRHFTFSLSAEAVLTAVDHADLGEAILVGHSMGGAIALTTGLWTSGQRFDGVVGIATSAYWVKPRQMVLIAAAPYVMGPRSPVLLRAHRREAARNPDDAARVTWEYAVRPTRQVLVESALELRRFDARRWTNLTLPPTTWVVTAEDGIIDPQDQRESAEFLEARRIEIAAEHSVIIERPDDVARILDATAEDPAGLVPRPPPSTDVDTPRMI